MQQPMDLDPEAPPSHKSDNSTTLHPQSNGAASSSGRSSPTTSTNSSNHTNNELYERELSSFNAVLASISPAAARAGVRQHWRRCLLGSSSDESFFIRSLMRRTSDHVMTRVLEDDQERILEVANEHYKDFLDQAMAIRLESISAKDLVAVLAKARRLGYDEMDLVEADELVVPAERPEANESSDTEEEREEKLQVEVPEVLEVESAPPKDNWAKERLMEFRMRQQDDTRQAPETVVNKTEVQTKSKSKRKVCPSCGGTFLQSAGLKYHIDRKVCERQRPTAPLKFWCDLCSKGFTTSGGLTYVCISPNLCAATLLTTS
jgi:ribosomal protein S27AE